MKRTLMISCYLLILLSYYASAHATPELPVFVQQADAICIGSVKDVEPQGQTSIMIGRSDGQPVMVQADNEVATVSVEDVLKGNLTQNTIKISFTKNAYTAFNRTRFAQLTTGERAIFFLAATSDRPVFSLTLPSTDGYSRILIGATPLTQHSTSPLRSTLLTLTGALSQNTKSVRISCLERLGSAGFLLDVSPDKGTDRFGVKFRRDVGELPFSDVASAASLEQFVKTKVLPAILQLTTDVDVDVRDEALIAAGNLQDVSIIPQLATIADKNYAAPITISSFRTPDAARPLIRVLSSKNADVRAKAAYALRNLADPLAVPFLLDHLDDPSPDARYYIVTALYTATNTPEYPGTVLFHDDEEKYASLWKKWAAEHQDKVAALREQFLAPMPVKAAPAQAIPQAAH